MLGLSFALLVALPIVCTAIYYGLIAAGKYSVEFRFSVRSATELVADEDNIALLIKAGKSGTHDIGRLPYMAADYLRSRNVVRELDRDGWFGCFSPIRRIGCASIRAAAVSGLGPWSASTLTRLGARARAGRGPAPEISLARATSAVSAER
jgi:hypothetical protein